MGRANKNCENFKCRFVVEQIIKQERVTHTDTQTDVETDRDLDSMTTVTCQAAVVKTNWEKKL